MKKPSLSISSFCKTGSGTTPSRSKSDSYFGGGIPWVKSGELRESIITKTEETVTQKALAETSLKIAPKGAILVAMYGANVGRVGILDVDATTNQAICHIVPEEDKADARYIFHALQQKLPEFILRSVGGAQPNISQQIIRETKIFLPPIDRQKRIAAILDKAEELKRLRRQSIEHLDVLSRSIFIEMFGDPVQNPKKIKVVNLSEITTRITDGVHQKPNYTESGVPFISVKNITTGSLKFKDCKFISLDDHLKFTKRCKAEYLDILYTKVGATYGRPAIVDTDREFSLYVSVCLIKPDKKIVDPFFLNAALGTTAIKNQADRRIKGIGVPDLHLDQIQNFLIPLPSMEDQHKFAQRIETIESLKAQHRESLTHLNILFASLQHRAFRGEL